MYLYIGRRECKWKWKILNSKALSVKYRAIFSCFLSSTYVLQVEDKWKEVEDFYQISMIPFVSYSALWRKYSVTAVK